MNKRIFVLMMVLWAVVSGIVSASDDKEEKISVTPYGYIKLDAIYETGNSSNGNYIFWAKDPGTSNGLFHVTANETRLGLNIQGFSAGKFKVTGKVEIDFYGGGAENKAYNFMRHAFLQISDGSLTIIAGQYWDIINPLNPPTLNYSVLWGAGNIGYRRPQLRLEKIFTSGKHAFTLQAGIFRTIAADYDNDGIEDGVAGSTPTFQGRIAGKFSLNPNSFLQLGLSGHSGKTKGAVNYQSNSFNVDFLWQISPKAKLIAEYFNGKNMGTFLGGILQNVNSGKEIDAQGFYVCGVASICKKIQISAGYGMDDPDDSTLTSGRTKNTTFFGNMIYQLSGSAKVGFEVSNWTTGDFSGKEFETLRLQNSWTLSF